MGRRTLTDAERDERRKANLAKVLAGRPNPGGHVGSEKMWRKLAEEVLRELGGATLGDGSYEKASKPRRNRTRDPDLDMFGLTRSCTLSEIRSAYLRLIKELHPDNKESGDLELAKAANAAYDRLKIRYA